MPPYASINVDVCAVVDRYGALWSIDTTYGPIRSHTLPYAPIWRDRSMWCAMVDRVRAARGCSVALYPWPYILSKARSTISSGHRSTISSGHRSTISSGHRSTISSGHRSTISSGHRSTISSGHQQRPPAAPNLTKARHYIPKNTGLYKPRSTRKTRQRHHS
jgi:hypothetical protein